MSRKKTVGATASLAYACRLHGCPSIHPKERHNSQKQTLTAAGLHLLQPFTQHELNKPSFYTLRGPCKTHFERSCRYIGLLVFGSEKIHMYICYIYASLSLSHILPILTDEPTL